MDNLTVKEDDKGEYRVRCHCGKVQGKFHADKTLVVAWECNCSDCSMRGNVHLIIPEGDFTLDMPENKKLNDETILYLWGTKTAKRQFCKTCGILPWYRPRSNPDGYAITLKCVDWGEEELSKPKVEFRTFNGINWEKEFAESDIAKQSSGPSCN
jgi:hypothetical protein